MASMKYTKIWILLNEYNFEVDINKCRDLICCICKNLLKNAQQSICGCEFCYDCIKNYLMTDEKYCPGRSNGCKELMVNIERNMQIDHAANKKVSNVVVKCPIEFCEFKTELKLMDEHIESHIDDNSNQGKFLREPLEKLKKEMSVLRDDLQHYKKDSLNKEMMIMKIRDEIDLLKTTNEAQMTEIKLLHQIISKLEDNGNKVGASGAEVDDDIDWQLEIYSGDIDGDLNVHKKRRIQESINGKESTSLKLSQEIRDIISVEVHKQIEHQNKVLAVMQEQIKLIKFDSKGKSMQIVDLTEPNGKETVESIKLPELSQSSNSADENSKNDSQDNNGNKSSTRRRLKRGLPQILATSASEESSVSDAKSTTPTGSSELNSKDAPKTDNKTESVKPVRSVPTAKSQLASKSSQPLKAHINTNTAKFNKPGFNVQAKQARVPKMRTIGWNFNRRNRQTAVMASKRGLPVVPMLIDSLHWMRNVAPFEFIVDNFTEKRFQAKQGFGKNLISQPFYTSKNGYKMCLRVDPSGSNFSSYLGVFFCMLRGENDDHLPWPMKMEITVSLIDQISFIPYTSRTFDFITAPDQWKFVFDRPTINNDHRWFGTPQFVHFDFLFSNSSLLVKDSILIRCSVGM